MYAERFFFSVPQSWRNTEDAAAITSQQQLTRLNFEITKWQNYDGLTWAGRSFPNDEGDWCPHSSWWWLFWKQLSHNCVLGTKTWWRTQKMMELWHKLLLRNTSFYTTRFHFNRPAGARWEVEAEGGGLEKGVGLNLSGWAIYIETWDQLVVCCVNLAALLFSHFFFLF